MLPFALSIAGVVVGIVLLVLYFPVGIPVLLIALIALLVVAVRSRRPGASLGTLGAVRCDRYGYVQSKYEEHRIGARAGHHPEVAA